MLLHAGEKPCKRLHKGAVVHDGIPLVAAQPGRRIAVILRQNQCVRIGLPHRLAELLPELMVEALGMPEIRRHIKAPSVAVIRRRNPFLSDLEDLVLQFLRALIIQLRQGVKAPPLLIIVVIRPAVRRKIKKFSVRTVCGLVRPRRILSAPGIDALAVHPPVKRSAVIENTVQNHPHACLVHL